MNYRFTEEINVVTVDTHCAFLELHKAVVDNEGVETFSLLFHKLLLQMYSHSCAAPAAEYACAEDSAVFRRPCDTGGSARRGRRTVLYQ